MSDKKDKKMDSIEEKIEELQGDVEFIYSLIHPDPPEASIECDHINDDTVEITEEIYNELMKYSENKEHLFMGIS